jgi:ATP/maltotriose-dependent transcriptional regulator MalT
MGYTMLAYLKQAQGDADAALGLLQKARALRNDFDLRQFELFLDPVMLKLTIILSRTAPRMTYLLADVARWVDAYDTFTLPDGIDPSRASLASRECGLARGLVALGRAAKALPLLERLLQDIRSTGRRGDEIEILVLQALAFYEQGASAAALENLDQALTLAQPQGYVRLFVDEGPSMAALLRAGAGHEYARTLLAAFDADPPAPHPTVPPLVDPLSERECDVLRLLVDGYKYQEIADQLFLALNTVRYHVKNIYGKLGVSSRVQATARAQELDLL